MTNDVFPNWLSTIPNFGKMPLYSTKLRMMLSIGSYVLIQPQSTDEAVVIRIVDYVGENVSCNVFDLLQSSECRINTSAKAYGMNELVQTCKKCTITINAIKDIVFLFTLNDVESGKVTHGGIRNCFLVRYRRNHLLELENVGYTYTFPCQSPLHIHFRTSTAAIIWNGVIAIQDVLWKIMNTESQNQLLNSPKIPANIDTVYCGITYFTDAAIL
jgi:hypothetical protein